MKKKIAIFASGEGTNAQRIIDYFKSSDTVEVALVLSNKANANVLNRAQKAGIPQLVVNKTDFYDSNTVVALLQKAHIDFIVLAGFLWIIPEHLVKAFPNKIINIHPSLLPKFGGKGMYGMHVHQAVVEARETESGISIHFVNEHYDEGKIIAQYKCKVSDTDTAESLAIKIHQLEYEHFPTTIEQVLA